MASTKASATSAPFSSRARWYQGRPREPGQAQRPLHALGVVGRPEDDVEALRAPLPPREEVAHLPPRRRPDVGREGPARPLVPAGRQPERRDGAALEVLPLPLRLLVDGAIEARVPGVDLDVAPAARLGLGRDDRHAGAEPGVGDEAGDHGAAPAPVHLPVGRRGPAKEDAHAGVHGGVLAGPELADGLVRGRRSAHGAEGSWGAAAAPGNRLRGAPSAMLAAMRTRWTLRLVPLLAGAALAGCIPDVPEPSAASAGASPARAPRPASAAEQRPPPRDERGRRPRRPDRGRVGRGARAAPLRRHRRGRLRPRAHPRPLLRPRGGERALHDRRGLLPPRRLGRRPGALPRDEGHRRPAPLQRADGPARRPRGPLRRPLAANRGALRGAARVRGLRAAQRAERQAHARQVERAARRDDPRHPRRRPGSHHHRRQLLLGGREGSSPRRSRSPRTTASSSGASTCTSRSSSRTRG